MNASRYSSSKHGYSLWALMMAITLQLLLSHHSASAAEIKSRRWRLDGNDRARHINFINKSGVKVDIFWINEQTGELAHSNTDGAGVPFGGDSSISSYVGHKFEVQEMPARGKCRGGRPEDDFCQKGWFRVSRNEDQTFTLGEDFQIKVEDHRTRAMDKAKETVSGCNVDDAEMATLDPTEQIRRLSQCMDQKIKQTIAETEEEIAFQAGVRVGMGQHLTRYACQDSENYTLTESTNNRTWTYHHPTTQAASHHLVQTPFDSPESTANLVSGMISTSQCEALEKYALSSDTRFGVPLEAKRDVVVLEFLLKAQDLVADLTERQIKFNQEPLLFMDLRKATATAEECSAEEAKQQRQAKKNEDLYELRQAPHFTAGSVTFFCASTGGALHFPKTAMHVPASQVVGSALVLSHNELNDEGEDVFNGEMAVCLPQEAGTQFQTFTFHFS